MKRWNNNNGLSIFVCLFFFSFTTIEECAIDDVSMVNEIDEYDKVKILD